MDASGALNAQSTPDRIGDNPVPILAGASSLCKRINIFLWTCPKRFNGMQRDEWSFVFDA